MVSAEMGSLCAVYYFGVRDLQVEPAILGTSIAVARAPYDVQISFPDRDAELPFHSDPRLSRGDVWGPFADHVTDAGQAAIDVRMIRGEAAFDAPGVAIASFDQGDEGDVGAAMDAFRAAYDPIADVLAEVLEWVRVRADQAWLGPSGLRPEKTGPMHLIDVASDERFPIGWSDSGPIILRSETATLTLDVLESIGDAVRADADDP